MLRTGDERCALAPQPGLGGLDALVRRSCGPPACDVELHVEGTPVALPPGVDLSAYRIVQEALTNALKHAAGRARRTVTRALPPSAASSRCVDDGPGGQRRGRRGHGLIGMRERVGAVRRRRSRPGRAGRRLSRSGAQLPIDRGWRT